LSTPVKIRSRLGGRPKAATFELYCELKLFALVLRHSAVVIGEHASIFFVVEGGTAGCEPDVPPGWPVDVLLTVFVTLSLRNGSRPVTKIAVRLLRSEGENVVFWRASKCTVAAA
jgi:hypothetical protein